MEDLHYHEELAAPCSRLKSLGD